MFVFELCSWFFEHRGILKKNVFCFFKNSTYLLNDTCVYIYIYVYIYISSAAAYHAASMDFPDSLLPFISIINCSQQIFKTSSCAIQIYCRSVLICQPTLTRPCEGVHRSSLIMSSSLMSFSLLESLEMGGKWLYSCCFVRCCFLDFFSIARSILVQFPSSLVCIHVVHPQSRIDTTTAWKKIIAVIAFARLILMSFSLDGMLLLMCMNVSTDFREPPFRVEMSPFSFWLKHMYSI